MQPGMGMGMGMGMSMSVPAAGMGGGAAMGAVLGGGAASNEVELAEAGGGFGRGPGPNGTYLPSSAPQASILGTGVAPRFSTPVADAESLGEEAAEGAYVESMRSAEARHAAASAEAFQPRERPYVERMRQPFRPSYGVEGRRTLLLTNVTPLHFNEMVAYQYDVGFNPSTVSLPAAKRRLLAESLTLLGRSGFAVQPWAYDGDKCLFVLGRMPVQERPGGGMPFAELPPIQGVTKKGKAHTIGITLREVISLDLSPLLQVRDRLVRGDYKDMRPLMHVLDIVLKHHNATFKTAVGPGVFDQDDASQHKALGRPGTSAADTDVWFGHRQTVVLTEAGPMLQVDLAATTMLAPLNVLDFLVVKLQLRNARELSLGIGGLHTDVVATQLKGKQIKALHNERKWRVRGVAKAPASETQFVYIDPDTGEEATMSVALYFEKQYGITLRAPHVPCLLVGREGEPVELPIEICCFVAGQRQSQLSNEQKANMIKDTCAEPEARYLAMKQIALKACRDPISRAFGVAADPSGLLQLEGRVLEPLPLVYRDPYGNVAQVRPDGGRGQWTLRSRGTDLCMVRPAPPVERWLVVQFVPQSVVRPEALQYFLRQLMQMAMTRGVQLSQHYETMLGNAERGVELQLQQAADSMAAQGRPLQLLFCVMPDRGSQAYLYPAVKRWANTAGGIASQCVLTAKLLDRAKYGTTFLSNMCLKLNVKLGGHNAHPSPGGCGLMQAAPTMVLGADVYHAPPGSDRASYAAIIGSMDRWLASYHTTLSAQPSRVEVIDEMESMMVEQLRRFWELNGQLAPRRIIFYRDGVGNSQFDIIRKRELLAIRRACAAVGGPNYQPKLVFLIVQKRTHARLFAPMPQGDGSERIGNAPPGTVVDSHITTVSRFDFYMTSHFGLKGTSKPTHYHVLCDDVGLTPDEIHRFTYDLCHLYCRCTKIISGPAPCHYAHLAAYNAHYNAPDFHEDDAWGARAAAPKPLGPKQGEQATLPVLPHVLDRLYFA